MRIFFYLILLKLIESYKIIEHPLEPRCAFIYRVDLSKINLKKKEMLYNTFVKYPLLIFRDNLGDQLKPKEFLDFLTIFDKNYDKDSIKNSNKILQNYNNLNCEHVTIKGNCVINEFNGIKNINIKVFEGFINNYLWHTDLLGTDKLPSVITGFYMLKVPLIGAETDFISGERIWENMTPQIQNASTNIIINTNKINYAFYNKQMHYSGSYKLNNYYKKDSSFDNKIPIVFAPDNNKKNEKPRILLSASFFENIDGLQEDESNEWIKNFMINHVLPYRFSIQWKINDIAIISNRRFIHSNTPAINYLKFKESSERLFLQSFLPTKQPLKAYKPKFINSKTLYDIKWTNNLSSSRSAINYANKFVEKYKIDSNNQYVLQTFSDNK